jgi:hypothetical protein
MSQTEAAARRVKPAKQSMLLAGVMAPIWLIVVTVVDGATRQDYNPWHQWVSHLELGDRGWLGVANLAVCGVLLVGYWFGLRQALDGGRRARWARRLVLLAGIGFVAAAAFRIDPGLGYPPGTPSGRSLSGSIHDLAGGVVFISLTIAAVLLGRSTPGNAKRGYLVAAVVATSFVACSVMAALDYAGTFPAAPSGLMERIALFAGVGWLGIVAAQLRRGTTR